MSKAINWPAAYRQTVLEEDTDTLRCAFRLGRLYYDHTYWVDGEEVDIRVNHKIIRKGVIVGALKCCPISQLAPADFAAQKAGVQSIDEAVAFLTQTYNQPVTPSTEVTVVYYRNCPLDPEILEVEDDPHM